MTEYRTSSFCSGGDCVATERDANGNVRVFGTKDPAHGVGFTAEEWAAFIAGVKAGEFDAAPAEGRHHVKITTDGSRGTVHVDGHDLGSVVSALTFKAGAGDISTVDLDVLVFTGEVHGQDVIVQLPDETTAALVALGWTPPSSGGES